MRVCMYVFMYVGYISFCVHTSSIMALFIHANEYIFFVHSSFCRCSMTKKKKILNQRFRSVLLVYTNLFSYVSVYLSLSTKLCGQFLLQSCLFIGLFPQNCKINSCYKGVYLLASFHKRCVNSYYNRGLFPRLYCKYILVYTDDVLSISFLTALDMASIMEV